DLVVDGKRRIAYVRPKRNTPPPYEHNRLGTVFAPVDPQSSDLIARVAEGSPAQEAGIRSGDVLLKIGEVDVTKWRTDPAILPLRRFWSRPVGTKLDLLLKRQDHTFEAHPVLRDILLPDSGPRKVTGLLAP